MPKTTAFDILVLIARPAAGKSEVINYLKNTDPQTRLERFHIREFEEIDDFPMLWTWFEEDHLLTQMGQARLHTDKDGYFIGCPLWDLLVERICLDYRKKLRDEPQYHKRYTSIIEFSRGTEHGGFARAFAHLSPQVVKKMAILYINVSWEESLRKNRQRFNPDKPDSILEHGLPDEKMENLYRHSDWEEISSNDPDFLSIQGYRVPYAVFENEDDVTTARGERLGNRLEETLRRLWNNYR